MATEASERAVIERIIKRPITDVQHGRWGFTNRTDIVTLVDGDRVVVQRYRRSHDAEYRLRVMGALRTRAADAGIVIPQIREFDLDADPPWVIFELLPGVPVPDAGDAGPDGPRFPVIARSVGVLLADLRRLQTDGLELNDLWADPARLAARATEWMQDAPPLALDERAALVGIIDRLPDLFAGRRAVLAHGDFAPVNILTDGESVTGLLDFESVRLADPLLDVAWWAWAVGFHGPTVPSAAWSAFLEGAAVDETDPEMAVRVHSLQVLRMLELLIEGTSLDPEIRAIVADRLRAALRGRP
jgi:aminoglycoside phosphotransferase (APT) family kinase protein